eukprot:SAG31_NODE_1228_length_9228_cov_5.337386_6_plen_170_part_00
MFIPEGWNHAVLNLADPQAREPFTLAALKNAEVDANILAATNACDSWYIELMRSKVAKEFGGEVQEKIAKELHHLDNAIKVNPTHGHLHMQKWHATYQKGWYDKLGKFSEQDNQDLMNQAHGAAQKYCVSYEPESIPRRNSPNEGKVVACLEHILGRSCKAVPCLDMSN